MALTADPVFVVPAYGWERAAWFAVHILASDASTSGLPLRWMSVDLNLPPSISDEDLTALWDAFHRSCEDLGIAVVTGHTGRYDGCDWPMVGGATCLALGPADAFVTPDDGPPGRRRRGDEGSGDRDDRPLRRHVPRSTGGGRRGGHPARRRLPLRVDDGGSRGRARTWVRSARGRRDVDARRDRGRGARRAARSGDRVRQRDPRRSGPHPGPAGGARRVRARRHRPVHRDQRGLADRDGRARASRRLRGAARGRRDRRRDRG